LKRKGGHYCRHFLLKQYSMKKQSLNLNNDDDLIAYLKQSNPSRKPVSIDRLRTYPGCENYTDEQAEEILKLLHELAIIILETNPSKNSICIDNQQVVYLNKQTDKKQRPLFTDNKNKAA
jgi:hypothetical protein